MKRRRFTGKVWLELTAGLYFPEPYSVRLHMLVLRGIRELVENSKVTIHPTDLPNVQVTKEKVDRTDIRGHAVEMPWDDRELEAAITRNYVNWVRFTLEGSGRPVTVATFLHDDTNVEFDIDFGLTGEEATGDGPLVPEDIGESRLHQVLDNIDPFWAVVGVTACPPDIEEVGSGKGRGFDYGHVYIGSSLAKAAGRDRLHRALSTTASVTDLRRGGFYISWTQPHKGPDPRYDAFVSLLREAVQRTQPQS